MTSPVDFNSSFPAWMKVRGTDGEREGGREGGREGLYKLPSARCFYSFASIFQHSHSHTCIYILTHTHIRVYIHYDITDGDASLAGSLRGQGKPHKQSNPSTQLLFINSPLPPSLPPSYPLVARGRGRTQQPPATSSSPPINLPLPPSLPSSPPSSGWWSRTCPTWPSASFSWLITKGGLSPTRATRRRCLSSR